MKDPHYVQEMQMLIDWLCEANNNRKEVVE
jgi:hypothetical protein